MLVNQGPWTKIFFRRYKEAKKEFRKQLRRKALEEVKQNSSLHRAFEMDRSEFHKAIAKKRKSNGKNGNVLKVDNQLIIETVECFRNLEGLL